MTDTALSLQNFIVLRELETEVSSVNCVKFDFENEALEIMPENPNDVVGIFGDEVNEDNQSRSGSENSENRVLKKKDESFRSAIKDNLQRMGCRKPMEN